MSMNRILVTDDEANIRLMLRTALESEGYRVDEAGDGRTALEIMRRPSRPDLVLLDLNMPVLDGMAVLEQLTHWNADTRPRVIVLTAYGSIPAAVKATRLGAVDFLEKPITPDALREAVHGALEDDGDVTIEAPAQTAAPAGFDLILDRIRRQLRTSHFEDAEALLARAADRRERNAAEHYNLLGVLYEAQHRWRLAKKFYGKAIAADGSYGASQINMRRMYELLTFGRSEKPVLLGDESAAVVSTALNG